MSASTTLPSEVAVLLPGADDAPRCADFTRSLGLAPQGSALDVAMLVLVETPMPWPKPVFDHELLSGLSGTFDSAVGRARILATVPMVEDHAGITVTCFWRDANSVTHGAVLSPSDPAELHECLGALRHASPADSAFRTEAEAPEQVVVVCTQGTHDICCGSEGTRLASVLELTRPDLPVYRVSHTGGHRFAPSVLTLPDGRMWAHATADDLDDILDHRVPPADVAELCRGWWGATGGAAQAAEVAVFAGQPWTWDHRRRTVTPLDDTHHLVTTDDDTHTVEVTVARLVPTVACRADGGLPAKTAPEFTARVVSGPDPIR